MRINKDYMYSGHIAFFGLELTREEFLEIFGQLLGIKKDFNVDDLDDDSGLRLEFERKRPHPGYPSIHGWMTTGMGPHPWIHPRCCYNDGKIFVGANLGTLEVVYRDEVDTFNNFEDYYKEMKEKIERIKRSYDSRKKTVLEDINKINPKLLSDVKLYTFANDCENCT